MPMQVHKLKVDAQIALDEFTEQSRQTNINRDAEILES
jgi:hypothetical protein